jgi:hypothetical protein
MARIDMKTMKTTRSAKMLGTRKYLLSSVISVNWFLVVALRERNMNKHGILNEISVTDQREFFCFCSKN